jgi:hypothetical protein
VKVTLPPVLLKPKLPLAEMPANPREQVAMSIAAGARVFKIFII